jgi:HD-like signal output (HDOD) protein
VPFEAETVEQNADRITRETGIPPCPAVLTKLLRETREDEPDFRRIGQLVGQDVGLAAAIVNIANSPFYGLRNKAGTVQHALVLLGLDVVIQRVTGLLLRQAFPSVAGSGMERYWKTSTAIAHIAAIVAKDTGRGDSEVSHTYGLFQNCGMPVMLHRYPIYQDLIDGSALAFGDPIVEIEEERYATNHAKIGAQLARNWQLSETMCGAILHHHDLPLSSAMRAQSSYETRVLVAAGIAAEQIYCTATRQACPEWDQAGEWVLEELEISIATLAEISGRVGRSLNYL